jgi:hypothetical protein
MRRQSFHSRYLWRLVLLFIGVWAVLFIRIDAPWYGIQEAPRIWIPAAVRNYDLIGTETIGWMIVRNEGPADLDNLAYYPRHPPLLVWIPAVMTKLFGFHELTIRYTFIALMLLTLAVFFALVRRLYDNRIAWWATVFYAITPAVLYYGRVPGYNIPGMLEVLLFALVLFSWLRYPKRIHWVILALLAWLAAWTAWTAVFFVGVLGVTALLIGQRRHRVGVVGLGIVSVIGCVSVMAYYQTQWPTTLENLANAFLWRTSSASDDPGTAPFTVGQWVWVTFVHTTALFTPGLLVLSVWGVRSLWIRGTSLANAITVALFVGAFGYFVVFRNASYVHDYYKTTLVPSLSIAAAAAWVYLRSEPRLQRFVRPLLDGLLLLSLVSGVVLLAILHRSGDRPWIGPVVETLTIHTTETDTIWTNLAGKDQLMPLRFYAYRQIEENLSYADALTQAQADEEPLYYIWCPGLATGESEPVDPAQHDAVQAGECWVLTIGV